MYMIAGLGNPGLKYAHTRHNAGFIAVDLLAGRLGARMGRAAHKASVGEGVFRGEKVLLIKPSTYMNLSGESLLSAVSYYRLQPRDALIVIYDDVDLPVGEIRIRSRGSAGTHNGMRSILYHLQTEEFTRIRVGIGKPPEGFALADYVLGKPDAAQQRPLSAAIENAAEAALTVMASGVEAAQQKYNNALSAPS